MQSSYCRLRALPFLVGAALAVWITLVPVVQAYAPDQAAQGASVYNERCSTCHGDVGQGLTDEFRSTWAEGDRNCWVPGCHGGNPAKPGGFTIPRVVPALVGPGTLARFKTAQDLHAFIHAAMPMQEPGVLSDDQYWALTAYFLRENGMPPDARALNAANAKDIPIPHAGQPVPQPNRTAVPRQSMPARERAVKPEPASPTAPAQGNIALAQPAPAVERAQATATPSPVPSSGPPGLASSPIVWTLLLAGILASMAAWRAGRKNH